ncbi:hypothetical protein KP509_08G029300 [Ceratopteris richardii]|nr:hypothetical protein KP509_08G029300 [Ceratopteris richardii]
MNGKKEKKEHNKKNRMVVQSAPATPMYAEADEVWEIIHEKKLGSIKVRSTKELSESVETGSSSFRCTDSLDAGSGLKLLLSPVTTPSSRSIPASSRFANITKNISFSGRHEYNPEHDFISSKKSHALDMHEHASCSEGMGDSEDAGSPLFDPSILATFEKAIEATSDDNWQASEVSTSSSSRNACSSSDVYSDADSPNHSEEQSMTAEALSANCALKQATQSQKPEMKCGAQAAMKRIRFQNDYWQDFELKCPPGCEEKIVLYFTSLRGIRKTYENCCMVKAILKGFGVPVDARDIWMHSKFKEELLNVMGTSLAVPTLFIKGRYIGGADDVKRLHDDGVLEHLLEGFPLESSGTCECCADVRFVPCGTCNGSCKMVFTDQVLRCPDCNENGLILCPACDL